MRVFLFVAATVAAASVSVARAADIYDARINIFEPRIFEVASLTAEISHNSQGGQIDTQTIRGTSNGRPFQFRTIRFTGSSGYDSEIDDAFIDNIISRASSMAKTYQLSESAVSNYRRIAGAGGRGASVDYQDCRIVVFGLRGKATYGFELVVEGRSCGDRDALTKYFESGIKVSDRATNVAHAALGKGAPAIAPAPQKPQIQINCEAAVGDTSKLAAFMRGLSQEQLTRFLDARQNCATFAGS